ncbi:hypothetical protein LJC08_00140 [Methanimicrococcus sp. OttesenSCG-928-J09]|nr:hypothetical protein [Methanimicrococcus sp. OttesenSCG-928-J09]
MEAGYCCQLESDYCYQLESGFSLQWEGGVYEKSLRDFCGCRRCNKYRTEISRPPAARELPQFLKI